MLSKNLIAPAQPALDQQWFDKLHHIDNTTPIIGLSRELFTVLGPDHENLERFQRVFNDIPFSPDLRHKDFDIASLAKPLALLQKLRQEIVDKEHNPFIAQAYAQRIDEVILNNDILIAAVRGDKAGFAKANHALYGRPNVKLFKAECAWLHSYARQYARSPNEYVRQCAHELMAAIPRYRSGSHKNLFPGNAIFQRVRRMHYKPAGYFDSLLGGSPIPEYVDAEQGDPILQNAIQTIGADYGIADSADELWGIVHHQRTVVRPANFHLPRAEFIGLVAHEIGSHLLERCNGRRQALRLLEIGLDRYEAGNEGRAFLREQLAYTSPYDMQHQPGFEYIVLKHLAISLGIGLADRPYSFRKLYDTMLPVCNFFQILRQPDNPVYAQETAKSETWQLLVRVLKGTDGHGGAYLKDIVYLEGNVRAWQAARRNPEIILFGDNGKFDIARRDHLTLLSAAGLTPPKAPLMSLRLR